MNSHKNARLAPKVERFWFAVLNEANALPMLPARWGSASHRLQMARKISRLWVGRVARQVIPPVTDPGPDTRKR